MPTFIVRFNWVVPICVNATAEVVAQSADDAERILLETEGDPKKMSNLDVEQSWDFNPWDFIHKGRPIEIEEIEEADADEGETK